MKAAVLSGTAYQLARIEAGGSALLNGQADRLVAAMAACGAPAGAGSVTTQEVREELESVLAETWQSG